MGVPPGEKFCDRAQASTVGVNNRDALRHFGEKLFRGGRINQPSHSGNAIGRKAHASGVFLNGRFVRREIHAVHFVAGDVAMQPLNLATHFFEDAERFFRYFAQFGVG
jgi:hypothetical protein